LFRRLGVPVLVSSACPGFAEHAEHTDNEVAKESRDE
jgi:iron only hydrogenase large subunit-like protein